LPDSVEPRRPENGPFAERERLLTETDRPNLRSDGHRLGCEKEIAGDRGWRLTGSPGDLGAQLSLAVVRAWSAAVFVEALLVHEPAEGRGALSLVDPLGVGLSHGARLACRSRHLKRHAVRRLHHDGLIVARRRGQWDTPCTG